MPKKLKAKAHKVAEHNDFRPEKDPKWLGRREDRACAVMNHLTRTERAALVIRTRADHREWCKEVDRLREFGLTHFDELIQAQKMVNELCERLCDLLAYPKRPAGKAGKLDHLPVAIEAEPVGLASGAKVDSQRTVDAPEPEESQGDSGQTY